MQKSFHYFKRVAEFCQNLNQASITEDFEDGDRFILEDFNKFSESHLWDLMLAFYDQKGPNSWAENIVPNVITSNPFIAKCYAKV